jgi:hypothetical protein
MLSSAARVCIPGLRHLGGPDMCPEERLETMTATVYKWLAGIDAAATEQLAAASSSPQRLQLELGALLLAQPRTQQGLTQDLLAELLFRMQVVAGMLCPISGPSFCNNPNCVNLSGPREVQLVSGRSCVCAGCRVARYCGRACQREVWKLHKPVCKSLAAIAAPPQPLERDQAGTW